MVGKKALIIGAGPAGLTAAYYLLKQTDILPIIYESSSSVGGISKTVVHNGNKIDLGGHRFFSQNMEIMDLWQSLLPLQGKPAKDEILLNKVFVSTEGPNPECSEKVMLKRNRISRIFYRRRFFDYPLSIKFKTFYNMGFFNTFKAGFYYLYSILFKRSEKTLEDFYINRFGKVLYQMFFENYTEKLWGVHPSKIDPTWGAQRVKGLSLFKAVFAALFKSKIQETSLIESFLYPKNGSGQLWEVMADEIKKMGGIIYFNHKVVSVQQTQNKIQSLQVCTPGGNLKTVQGDFVFSSMPIKDLIDNMNDVPENIKNIATTLPYRDFMMVGILLSKLKLKNSTNIKTLNNIVPDCWIYIQEPNVKMGRIQIFNNWSPYMLNDPENKVWIGLEYFVSMGDDFWNMSDKDFIQFAIEEASEIGIFDKENVLDSIRVKVEKAYPAYLGSYKDFNQVRTFLNNFENLYCIGRNGQHRYNNMDHSMLTAIEAVRCVKNTTDKSIVWNVNTESKYHETISK